MRGDHGAGAGRVVGRDADELEVERTVVVHDVEHVLAVDKPALLNVAVERAISPRAAPSSGLTWPAIGVAAIRMRNVFMRSSS